ncbi:hypothetical protein N2152v2_005535 [Parachlorella kessleri]
MLLAQDALSADFTIELSDSELSAYVLLELSSPAIRYLRAFTVPCWRPAPSLPSSPLDGSWAVALVTLWNDLTAPNNGLGRLVTAQQLHAEAAAMLGEERYSDSLAILELSVLLRLYPFQPPGQLAAWQRSMALAGVAHPRVRLQLARTLVLVARARAGAGAAGAALTGRVTHADVELLEGALLAAEAALALFQTEGVTQEDGPADPSQLPALLQRVKEQVAALLGALGLGDLRALAAERGVVVENGSTRRAALQALLPMLRVPLQLLDVASPSRSHVAVAPDSTAPPRYSEERYTSDWELYRAVVGDVLTLLPATLLQEVGIQCEDQGPGAGGCQAVIDGQLEAQAGELTGPRGAHRREVEALLGQADLMEADLMEEVLWRLEEVLAGAAAGVRMADGTTWLRQAGWDWWLAPSLHARLYPPGAAMPEHDSAAAGLAQRRGGAGDGQQAQQPQQPLVGDQLCLDKTFLLDTVVKMDLEALQGVQYALDNLHYAQFSAGSAERFWQMLGSSQLEIGLDATHRAQLAQLLSAKYGTSAPAGLDGMLGSGVAGGGGGVWKREGATSDSLSLPGVDSSSDPFFAAFLGMCALGVASVYVYGNRRSLLPPWQGRLVGWGSGAAGAGAGGGPWEGVAAAGQGAGGRSVARRHAATGALREVLAEGNQRRLAAAIEEAEASGVERPLLEKARKAVHALRKKKSQGKPQNQTQQAVPSAAPRQGPQQPEPPAVAPTLVVQSAQAVQGNHTVANSEGAGAKKGPGASTSAHRRTLSGASVGATGVGGSSWDAFGAGSVESGGSLPRSLSDADASLAAEAAWEAPREVARRSKGAKSAQVDLGGERQPPEASPARPGSRACAEVVERQPPAAAAVQAVRTGGGAKGAGTGRELSEGSSGDSSSGAVSRRRGVKPAAAPLLLVPQQGGLGQLAPPCLSRKTSSGSDPPTSPGTPLDFNPSRSTSAGADSLEPPSPPCRTPADSPQQPLPARPQKQAPPPPAQQAQQQADAAAPLRARLRGSPVPIGAQQAQHQAQVAPARQALSAASPHARHLQESVVGAAGLAAPYFAGSEPPRTKVLVVARPQRNSPSAGKWQSPKQPGGSAAPSPKQPAQARNAGAAARAAGATAGSRAAAAFTPPPPPPPKPSHGSSSQHGSHGATSPAQRAASSPSPVQQRTAPPTTAGSAGGSALPAAPGKAPAQPPQATVTFTPAPADTLSPCSHQQQGLLRHGSGGAWSSKSALGAAAGHAALGRQRHVSTGTASSAPSSPRVAHPPPPPPPRQHAPSFPAAAGSPRGPDPPTYRRGMAGAAYSASLDASPRSPGPSGAAAAIAGRSASHNPSPFAGGERDPLPISSWTLGTAAVPDWARQGRHSPVEYLPQPEKPRGAGRAVQFHPAGAPASFVSPYTTNRLLAALPRQASASPGLFDPGDPYDRPAAALLAHHSLPTGYSAQGMGVYGGVEGVGEAGSPRPAVPASAPAPRSLGPALSPHQGAHPVSATHQSPELLGKLKEIWGEESDSVPGAQPPRGPMCGDRPASVYAGSVSPCGLLAHGALPSSSSSQSSRHSSGQGLLPPPTEKATAAVARAPASASPRLPLFAPNTLLVPAPELSWGWQGGRDDPCAGRGGLGGSAAWAQVAQHSVLSRAPLLGESEAAEEVPGPSMSLDLAQLGFTELGEA